MNPRDRLDELTGGFRATQVVRTAAVLGIADVLSAGPLAAPAVALHVGGEPGFVRRLLRCLAALGVLTESEDGRFANSAVGELLRTDVPDSMRSIAVGRAEDSWWAAWAQLPTASKDGGVPYELAHGRSFWDEVRDEPDTASRFNAFMASKTTRFLTSVLQHYDFSRSQHIIDVGGGSGALLGGILQATPRARGTVFDLDSGLSGAPEVLAGLGLLERCEVAAGSFFDEVPTGGDVYILRQILHDWPDDRARDILFACRRSMRPGAKLLVIDQSLPERAMNDAESRFAFESDLHMFVLFGSRERTERELVDLLTATGFSLDEVLPTRPESTFVAIAE